MDLSLIKLFLPTALAFLVGIAMTPTVVRFSIKHKLWKRYARKDETKNPDKMSPVFQAIHNSDDELRTSRIGGVIIWLSTLTVACAMWLLTFFFPSPIIEKLNFISRDQTLILLVGLFFASLIGLVDDALCIYAHEGKFSNGFPRIYMIVMVVMIGLVGGTWFYEKLGASLVHIPFDGSMALGILFIPFFMLVLFGVFSSGVIDGIDGLAGGVMATIFAAYATIAFFQNQINVAVFCGVITGALLAFLWFNIPPARFYLGESGMLGLTVSLTLVAFLTNTVLILPIIALPLTLTALSSAIQIISKKFFHYKVFRVAPLHHHFQSLGWSREKVTMRYWVISVIFAIIGIVLSLIS